MYTAILFATDCGGSGETLTLSREVSTENKQEVLDYMTEEAGVSIDEVDTILLVRNGTPAPEVFKHWTGQGGDFEECSDEDADDDEESDMTDSERTFDTASKLVRG